MVPTMCKRYMFKLCLILIVVRYCDSKVFTACSLARELVEIDVREIYKVSNAVCIARFYSKYNTSKVEVKKGIKTYDIFQIPEKWCKVGEPGGGCNLSCETLLDDDIYRDTQCFFKIVKQNRAKGYAPDWPLWVIRCMGQRSYYVKMVRNCGLVIHYTRDPIHFVPDKSKCPRNTEL